MPLVFLPQHGTLFLWGDDPVPQAIPGLRRGGTKARIDLVTPKGRRVVPGVLLPLLKTTSRLAVVPAAALETLPASVATWALASKVAIHLAARERIVPAVVRRAGRIEARWAAALAASEDAANVAAIARSMPPAAHAVPAVPADIDTPRALEVWAPEALLRAYLDAVVDGLVRDARGGRDVPKAPERTATGTAPRRHGTTPSWEQRWIRALEEGDATFDVAGSAERGLVDELERWSAPAAGARDRLRACFRLELPELDGDLFTLRFLLQSPEDPSLLVSAEEAWRSKGRRLERFGRAFRDPQDSLLEALRRAARLFAPLERALREAAPERLVLDPSDAWTFLDTGAAALADAGFGVMVPSELTAAGQRRLRLRLRVGSKTKVAGAVGGVGGLTLGELLAFTPEAVIGDDALTPKELEALSRQKASLVRFRGAWVAIDPRELHLIQQRLAAGPGCLTVRDAIEATLAGEIRQGELSAAVVATGTFEELLERLRDAATDTSRPPRSLNATLRPYQARGLAWLSSMASLGLGACLADDMGLGKTLQVIAFLMRRRETAPDDARPSLLVAPTSVIGNWEREIERFAPTLPVVRHYASERARSIWPLTKANGALVLTTYGVLRRDAELLSRIDWAAAVLDEAQNIKNAASSTARAARSLQASHRFALTGTPVENRLAELWSILEFANPGLLGPLDAFRRDFAMPIERHGEQAPASKLRRIVGPFLLRRLKSDPAIISDLPPKNEMKVVCTLTREQATLYRAVVDEEMRHIEASHGIERRGRVLALIMFLKQICNHPAQYLSERGPLAHRSGKLARVTEMLEEALAAGDRALVFTQFREMGDRLVAHLESRLGTEVMFLHGGSSKTARDQMVRRFQDDPRGPRVFVLSLKAGGTGLNLTAASHVFHYDRWWNPAVEDQATDRAYRIGQKRAVQVHALLCAGTVEEKVDDVLARKRDLASRIVGAGESWITEMGDAELRGLFALSGDASSVGDDEADDDATGSVDPPEDRDRLDVAGIGA